MGYSGSGKSNTIDGHVSVFGDLVSRLPKVPVTAYGILRESRVLGSYEPTIEIVEQMSGAIMKARVSGKTPAHAGSRRTHLAIAFNGLISDCLYGVVLEVAGCQKTEDIG